MSLKIGAAMKKKIISTVVALSVIGVSSFCVFNNMASAVTKYYNEALTSSLVNCIDHGIFKSTVNAGTLNGSMWDFVTTVGTSVYTPLGFLNTAKDPSLVRTCGSIVQKIISNKGLSIPTSSSSEDTVDRFLKTLGYKKSSSSETQNNDSCFRLVYNSTDGSVSKEAYSKYICVKTDNKGNIIGNDVSVSGDGTVRIISVTGGSSSLTVKYNISGGGVEAWGGGTITVPIKSGGDSSFDGFKTRVKDAIIAAGASKGKYEVCYETGVCDTTNYDLLNAEGNANIQVGAKLGEYTLTVDDASKRLITGTLMNSSIGTYPTFSQDEQFNMYQDYMNNYYKADVHCDWTADQAAQKVANDGYVEVTSCSGDGTTQPCYAKATTNEKRSVGGIDGNRHFGVDCDFNCVASWLKSYGSSNNTCPAVTTVDKNPTGSSGGDGEVPEDIKCDKMVDEGTNGEGVGAMQWILCPTLDNSTYTANWVDNMTQDMLEVKSSLYEPGSPTQEAWGKIRDAANVLMVLFLLVIIFSQLTGYGIDNYGIKKMLPRLITMAIIVNLSFYICAIAVDISNIAGTGLRDLFGGIGSGLSGGAVDANTGFVSTSVTGLFTAAGIGGGAAVGAAGTAVTLGAPLVVAILIAALVLVLVVIVAVVILYLMLGVREIIIIFCVLISPLAFAAFILPNTQHLFKKWWNLFKAAIIIFPICGAVAGISYILKNITTGSDVGIGTKAVMMVMPFVGFFFLPELLKQAIAALGKLGGALTSMGQTMRGGARTLGQGAMRGMQNSEWFKDRAEQSAFNRRNKYNAWISRRYGDKKDLSDSQKRRLYRAQTDWESKAMSQALANEGAVYHEEGAEDDVIKSRAASAKEAQEIKLLTDRNTTYTRGQMENELNAAVDGFKEGDEKSYYRLQAALSSAQSRGMDREMLEGRLAGLALSNADGTYGAKIASSMAGSNNQVVSQFGKARFKNGAAASASINDFMNDSSNLGFAETFKSKGANYVVGMNEDILNYVKDHGGALTTEQLVKAAGATSNTKELAAIREMLKGRTSANSGGYQVGVADLASLDTETLNGLINGGDAALFNDARAEIIRTKNTDATRQLLDRMNQDARNMMLTGHV